MPGCVLHPTLPYFFKYESDERTKTHFLPKATHKCAWHAIENTPSVRRKIQMSSSRRHGVHTSAHRCRRSTKVRGRLRETDRRWYICAGTGAFLCPSNATGQTVSRGAPRHRRRLVSPAPPGHTSRHGFLLGAFSSNGRRASAAPPRPAASSRDPR